ncbi:hypothetical protein LJC17_04205 [Acholeplasma sp. OttesenSCG-928-E16]|nr:hypothetical protein [Acholeplasma sp. OttesenSCG-928-E16]
MKKLGLLVLSVFLLLGVVACDGFGGGGNSEKIDEVLDRLSSIVQDEYSKGEYYLYKEVTSDGTTYAITWSSNNSDALEVTSTVEEVEDMQQVKIIVKEVTAAVDVVLTAKIKSRTKDFNVKVLPQSVLTLDQFRSAANGLVVSFAGVVTHVYRGSNDRMDAFIQAKGNAGGILVYNVGAALQSKFVSGNEVVVTGTKDVAFGQHEIKDATAVSVVSEGNALEAKDFTKGADINNVNNQFALANITGVLKNKAKLTGKNNVVFASTDDQVEFDVRFENETWKLLQNEVAAGTKISVTKALISSYSSVPQLTLYNDDQITIGSLASAAELKALASAHFDSVIPNDNDNVVANVVLPTTAPYGASISWSSDKPTVMANDGTITRPSGADSEVVMTYTAKYGEESIGTGTVNFTVKQAVSTGELEAIFSFAFPKASDNNTSYSTATGISLTDGVSGSAVTIVDVHRVAFNHVTSQSITIPETWNSLVLSPRLESDGSAGTGNYNGVAYAIFNIGSVIKEISFDVRYWNTSAASFFSKVELQYKNGSGEWVTALDIKAMSDIPSDFSEATIAAGTCFKNVVQNVASFNASAFRLYAEGGKAGGNDARMMFDNIIFKA